MSEENTNSKEASKQPQRVKKANRKRKKSTFEKVVFERRLILILAIAVVVLVSLFGVLKLTGVIGNKEADVLEEEVTELAEEIPAYSFGNDMMGAEVVEHILKALNLTGDAYGQRPETIELTEENKDHFLSVSKCMIEDNMINIEFSSDLGVARSDDKFYYLFAINSYDDSGDLTNYEFLDRCYKDAKGNFTADINLNTPESRLYKKFGIAVKNGEGYELIGAPSFITNPEALATHDGFMEVDSKKGILIDYNRVFTGQLEDLGVKQAAINIPISSIMGPTTNAMFPSVQYSYDGRNYTFNGMIIAGFDQTVAALTEKGIQTTAILLNDYTYAYPELIHPDARSKGACPYYMFNGATDDGVEILAAVGAFLADRYCGTKHGKVSNWVIANEINARKEWNYLKYTDVDTYTKEYAKGFRVLYTAIKSVSENARVLISLDQTWNRKMDNSDYDGKDVVDCFNAYIKKHGNIDWSVAYHPYNIPLTSCKIWDESTLITHDENTASISMQNIDVLVNYMNKEELLNPNGECRSIMITELGYTSSAGEQLQAAALAYAFYKINHYEDIDSLLLNRQTDSAIEIAQGLATGITTSGNGKKASYDVYKYMDTDQWAKYLDPLKTVIGISSWDEIMY